jgi:hypothetical protein
LLIGGRNEDEEAKSQSGVQLYWVVLFFFQFHSLFFFFLSFFLSVRSLIPKCCAKCCYYGLCCCACNLRCFGYQHRPPVAVAEPLHGDRELDVAASRQAVGNIPRAEREATFFGQLFAVLLRQWLILLRGAWRSAIFLVCMLLIISSCLRYMDSRGRSSLLVPAMIVPSSGLLFTWLVVSVVKDNNEGLVE